MNSNKFLKKYAIIPIIIISMLLISYSNVFAADYDQRFVEADIYNGSDEYGRSPKRDASYNDIWAFCSSKCNQPRQVSADATNPHQGSDLRMSAGENVYPIDSGTVTYIDRYVGDQKGNIRIRCYDADIGYFYVEYMHINPSADLDVGDAVTENTILGKIDIERPDGYTPHLHWGRLDSTGTYWYKLYPFFRWVSEWYNGSHLDYISGGIHSSNNVYYISAYARSSYGTHRLRSLNLYYKIGSSGTWTGPVSFTLSVPSIERYEINFRTATGASPGQTVYYYIAGIRENDPGFNTSYRHGYYHQYYKHPGAPPLASSYANTICESYVIQ